MANTYSQIYIQIVFAVKGRENLIKESFRDELEKYICGTVDNLQQKPLAIYCMPDHLHLLVGLKPAMAVADLVRDVKANATKIIKEKRWVQGVFEWQTGYGAFSYAKSQLDNVIQYVLNQPQHHQKKTFKEEYLDFLQKFEIDYKEEYLFDWIE